MQLLTLAIFSALIAVSVAEIRCGDITTRRAIEKRGRQINLKCIENREQLEKCNNRTAVDIAWKHFEDVTENYTAVWDSCKEMHRQRRHVHGTSDDKEEEEVINDYSKDFLRSKRYTCLEDANREKTRLLEKFATLCDKSIVCDRDKMTQFRKDDLNNLSKERQRAYSNYVTSFQLCYGPVN